MTGSQNFTLNEGVAFSTTVPMDTTGMTTGALYVAHRFNLSDASAVGTVTINSGSITISIPSGSVTPANFPGYFYVTLNGVTKLQGRAYFNAAPVSSAIDNRYALSTGGGGEMVKTVSASGTTTLNLANGNIQDVTLNGNTTFIFTGASGTASTFTLILRQDASGNRLITWPGSVKWPGGQSPVLSTGGNKYDVVTFVSVSGGAVWNGFLSGVDLG